MYPVPSQCPVCSHHLIVTDLSCERCDTALTGRFSLGRLHRLTPDQLQFVELFILCEGKINRVEQELGMSYPAVRAQLQEVIQALGQEAQPQTETSTIPAVPAVPAVPAIPATPPTPPVRPRVPDEQRREILAKVSAGEITAKEAAALLNPNA